MVETSPLRFIATLFTIAKRWTQPKRLSVVKWLNKLWYVYAMGKDIVTHAMTGMSLEDNHAKCNKPDTKR